MSARHLSLPIALHCLCEKTSVMAEPTDSSLVFFTKATPEQWKYVLSLYKDVLKAKASTKTKKGGAEELIRLDTWYQEQLPKIIHTRKEPHIIHEELIQIIKWKLIRGKFRPRLIDLVRINTELAVFQASKKAFRRMRTPKISSAINALTCLKGIGPSSASAILAAAYPEHIPYMADESMLSTPGIEGTDYTLSEYLNYHEKIKVCANRLNSLDSESKWNPHKVEMALWTHYLARELNSSLLDNMPRHDVQEVITPNGNDDAHADKKEETSSNDDSIDNKEEGHLEHKEEDTSDGHLEHKEEDTSDGHLEHKEEDTSDGHLEHKEEKQASEKDTVEKQNEDVVADRKLEILETTAISSDQENDEPENKRARHEYPVQ